jgi:PPIC-type PPIASE domain
VPPTPPSIRGPVRRLVATAAVAAAVALLTAGCGDQGPAATVNGRAISADRLESELDAIQGNEAYVDAFEQNTQIPVQGDGDGTFSQALLAEVLRIDIIFDLIRQELDTRGLKVDDTVREQARQQALCQLAFVGGPSEQCEAIGGPVLDAFPDDYQEELVDRWAAALTLDQALREQGGSDEAVEAYYEDHANRYAQTCLSHILVASEEQAADLHEQIQGGADFAELAATASSDTGSAQQGGELGCSDLTQYVQEFADAAEQAEVGEVTDPVQSQFGWHLILVTSRDPAPPLDEVRDLVAQDVGGQSDINGWLDEALSQAEIDVDDRYGTWNDTTGQIDPPEGPTTTSTAAPAPFPSVTIGEDSGTGTTTSP